MIIYPKNRIEGLGDYPPDPKKWANTRVIITVIGGKDIAIAKCCIQGDIAPHHVTDSSFSEDGQLTRIR
jgi:hypothetical protein